MKITQASAAKAALPASKSEAFFWDDEMPGFGLRIRAGGSRTYIVQYKLGAKHRRMTLGSVSKVAAEDARKRAKLIFGKVVEGKDPANERAAKVAEAATGFGASVTDYLAAKKAHVKPRTLDELKRYLNKAWKPLHKLSLSSVNRALVAAELRKIANERGPIAADRARAALSDFFGWAIGEGLVESNPVTGTNKAAPDYKSRDRVLGVSEVAAIWNAVSPRTPAPFDNIVKLLLLTACRRNEIGHLRTAEIALGDSLVSLPAERTKNGLPHDVPLSGLARDVVASLDLEDREFAFGRRDSGFSGWSKAKRELDAKLGKSVKPWTLHDIRRTVATGMADLGVQPHIIESVLNHISGHKRGVAGTYNRATYAAEKRDALDRWANHLQTLLVQVDGGNVVKLRPTQQK